MPGRLIVFILTLLIIVTFIGMNVENSSNIRVWFGDSGLLSDVPIFISFFIMYLLGVLSVVPFFLGWRWRRRKKRRDQVQLKESRSRENVKSPKKRTGTMKEGIGDAGQNDVPAKNAKVLGSGERTLKSGSDPEASRVEKVAAAEKGQAVNSRSEDRSSSKSRSKRSESGGRSRRKSAPEPPDSPDTAVEDSSKPESKDASPKKKRSKSS